MEEGKMAREVPEDGFEEAAGMEILFAGVSTRHRRSVDLHELVQALSRGIRLHGEAQSAGVMDVLPYFVRIVRPDIGLGEIQPSDNVGPLGLDVAVERKELLREERQ